MGEFSKVSLFLNLNSGHLDATTSCWLSTQSPYHIEGVNTIALRTGHMKMLSSPCPCQRAALSYH